MPLSQHGSNLIMYFWSPKIFDCTAAMDSENCGLYRDPVWETNSYSTCPMLPPFLKTGKASGIDGIVNEYSICSLDMFYLCVNFYS